MARTNIVEDHLFYYRYAMPLAPSIRCLCRTGSRQNLAGRPTRSSLVSLAILDQYLNGAQPAQPHHQQCRTFAGHNKWSKIKRKKGANDVARSMAHGKVAKAIQAASRKCSGDMANLHLQSTIAAAKAVQLPKDRIEFAIDKGANPSKYAGEELADMRYDGMLATKSGKVAVIVSVLTDNKKRSAANIRSHFRKCGGEMTETGSNDWMFDHIGYVTVPMGVGGESDDNSDEVGEPEDTATLSQEEAEEALLECALEGGASDVDFISNDDINDGDNAIEEESVEGDKTSFDPFADIRCEPTDLHKVVTALNDSGYKQDEFGTRYVVKDEATGVVKLCDESIETLEKLLEKLDGDDDVAQVYHNAAYE